MWFRSLFDAFLARSARRPARQRHLALKERRRPRSFRPRLDILEDRSLPSTYMVNSLTDTGAGSGLMGDLRYCVTNATSGNDTIAFGVTGTIDLESALPGLNTNVAIRGPGATQLTVERDRASTSQFGFFAVGSAATVQVSGLTLAKSTEAAIYNTGTVTLSDSTLSGNSITTYGGGAIYNKGTLTLSHSTLSGNSGAGSVYNTGTLTISDSTLSGNVGVRNFGTLTVSASALTGNFDFADLGGAIYNTGTLTVSDSTLAGNNAYGNSQAYPVSGGEGGAIYNTGTLTVSDSTFAGNTAYGTFGFGSSVGAGGAIYSSSGAIAVSNSTFTGNDAVGDSSLVVPDYGNPWTIGGNAYGGGVYVGGGTASIDHSTFASNSAAGGYGDPGYEGIGAGGGIYNAGGLQMYDTILAGDTAAVASDLAGAFTSLGHNLIGNSTGGSGYAASDLLNVDPRLGPLQNNGGPTQTMALLAGSPVINAGDNSGAPAYDQRGPGFPRIVGGAIDIGALENQGAVAQQASNFVVTSFPSSTTAGAAGNFTVTAKNADGTTATAYTSTVRFSSSDSQAGLPADYTFTTADNGMHTFSATLKTAGTQLLTAKDVWWSTVTGTQSGISVNPAAASKFIVRGPAGSMAGSAFSVTVTASDPYNNTATSYAGTVHFTSTDGVATLPGNYTFMAADASVHTFTGVILKNAGSQTLTATETVTSSIAGGAAVMVSPAAASTMTVAGFPSTTTAGVAANLTVTLKDPYGNIATGYTGTVHFTSSDGKASLPAYYTFTAADAGVLTFGATLKTAGTQSLTATDTMTASLTGTEGGITVNPAAASQFIISGPSSVTAGVPFSLTITAKDAYDNVVIGYTGTIHFSSTDHRATLPADYTFTAADKGVHNFTGLALRKKGTQKITPTDTRNSSLTVSVIENVL